MCEAVVSMTDSLTRYGDLEDADERYHLLRSEAKQLRREAENADFRGNEAIYRILRDRNAEMDGVLLAFLANDFGWPVAFRPEGTEPAIQDRVRKTILEGKYRPKARHEELEAIQEELLEADKRIHKGLVAVVDSENVDYFLPEGKQDASSFLTVREPLGLIDWTTNSSAASGFQRTY